MLHRLDHGQKRCVGQKSREIGCSLDYSAYALNKSAVYVTKSRIEFPGGAI